jgi:hypothetical protein
MGKNEKYLLYLFLVRHVIQIIFLKSFEKEKYTKKLI